MKSWSLYSKFKKQQRNKSNIVNSKNNQIYLTTKMNSHEARTRTGGFPDGRRESLKASIKLKQAQFLTYSSMGVGGSAAELPAIASEREDEDRYPQINVETVAAEKKDEVAGRKLRHMEKEQVRTFTETGKRKKALVVAGRLSGKIKIKKAPVERQVVVAQEEGPQVRNILIGSRSQRYLDRVNRGEELRSHRSLKKVDTSRMPKPSMRKAPLRKHESLKQIIASNPNMRILRLDGLESSDSEAEEETAQKQAETAEAKEAQEKEEERLAQQKKKAEEREQRLQDKKHVMEVRDLLHKSVYPDGHEAGIFRGRTKREIERQFQSIYYTNQLQPSQLPLPRVTSDDFRNLQQSLGTGRGRRARLDSVKYTIRSQAYKGNKQISSRGQNLINLVSPLRSRPYESVRPPTAHSKAEKVSDVETRDPEKRPESRATSQRQDLEGQSALALPRPSALDDSAEAYKNEQLKSYQQKDARNYVKRVLLEDIVYHKLMGQEEKIYRMQKDGGEHGKMVLRLSRRANKLNHRAPTALPDTSDGPSKSNENLYGSDARPGSRPNDYSDLSKSQVSQSGRRSKSIVQSRPAQSSQDGASINELLQDGAASHAPVGDYDPHENLFKSGLQARGASTKKDQWPDRAGAPPKAERNASARLIKASNAAALTGRGLKKRASIGMSQHQVNSSLQVSQDGVADGEGQRTPAQAGGRTGARKDRSFNLRNSTSPKDASASQMSSVGGQPATRSQQDHGLGASTPQHRNQSTDRQRATSSKSRSPSEEQDVPRAEDESERPLPLSDEQKEVIRLIRIPSAAKTEEDIGFLYSYFNKFDFLQAQKKDKESKKKFSAAASQRQQQKQAQEMAKDQKSIEQMCRVTKYLFVEKGQTVFDYESQGDLFYMVISGRVLCKIPFFKQMVLLSQAEKALFQVQFKEDLLGIQEAVELNKQLQLHSDGPLPERPDQGQAKQRKSAAGQGRADLSKLQHLKNPYDLEPRLLHRYSREVLARTHTLITNRKRKELNGEDGAEATAKGQGETQDAAATSDNNDQPETDQSVHSDDSSSEEGGRKRRDAERKKQMKDPEYLAQIDPEYTALKEAFQNLLEDPDSQVHRKYYQVNIMKLVKTYNEHGSFGELALITNKRRKAKLETHVDTHFAVLSKEDYRQAQYKAQNQRLKEKILFLRNFDLFSMLSESQLSVLSYHMQEQLYYRGQIVYKEGVDPVDKIYLIRQGDFLLSKQLIRKVDTYSAAEVLKEAQSVDLSRSTTTDACSNGSTNQSLFSFNKFKNLQSLRAYATTSRHSQAHEIQICILGDRDAFGYQELLERDVERRSCTVRCLRNESPVVTIDKHSLISIVRSNPKVLEQMKVKWTQFLVDRVSNKLFVEQLLEEAKEEQGTTASPKKQQLKELELQELKRSMQQSEEDSFGQDPQKVIEEKIEKHNQNRPMLHYGESESLIASGSTRNLLGERIGQPTRSGSTFQYKSKAGNRVIGRPNDELLLQEYADDFHDRFWIDKGQGQSHRAKSERKPPQSSQFKGSPLDGSFDESERRGPKQRPTAPGNYQMAPYGASTGMQDDQAALRTASFGGGENRAWPAVQHPSEDHRPGHLASPLRRPVFLHPLSGSSSEEHQGTRPKSELLLHPVRPGYQAGASGPGQALMPSDGTHHAMGDDLTFHRTSALQAQNISTPATVVDLVDIDKSRQSAPLEMLGMGAFGLRGSRHEEAAFRLDSSQQPLSTDRDPGHRLDDHAASRHVPATFGQSQQHRRTSQEVRLAMQARVQPAGAEPPDVATRSDEFANWTNTSKKGAKYQASQKPANDSAASSVHQLSQRKYQS